MAGLVKVDGSVACKAGALVSEDAPLTIAEGQQYVGRGGKKLEFALRQFEWWPTDLRCLDVGASTGGFTDCLLAHGARCVAALDVGYGQLAWKLRQDSRVAVIERTNFRYAVPAAIGAPFDLVVADVSFISLSKVAANLAACLAPGGRAITLVKPQFEVGRSAVGRGGVVSKPGAHVEILSLVASTLAACGLAPCRVTHSPLRGPAGNIEFFIGAVFGRPMPSGFDPTGVVRRAHEALRT